MPPLTLRALLPTGKYGASLSLARGCVYSSCLSFSLTLRLASTSAASAAACAASRRCLRAAYSGSVSQWVASAYKAASSPTSAERSRAVSLVTSFGSCGPTTSRTSYATIGARLSGGRQDLALRTCRILRLLSRLLYFFLYLLLGFHSFLF